MHGLLYSRLLRRNTVRPVSVASKYLPPEKKTKHHKLLMTFFQLKEVVCAQYVSASPVSDVCKRFEGTSV
jgi:hypothetical protein